MPDIRTQNRAFEEMRKPALDRLQGKDAKMIAEKTGIAYNENRMLFSLTSMGEKILNTHWITFCQNGRFFHIS